MRSRFLNGDGVAATCSNSPVNYVTLRELPGSRRSVMMQEAVEEHFSGVVFLVIVGLDVDLILLVYESMEMLEKRDFRCIHHEKL
jgi:hypothetical protein